MEKISPFLAKWGGKNVLFLVLTDHCRVAHLTLYWIMPILSAVKTIKGGVIGGQIKYFKKHQWQWNTLITQYSYWNVFK